MSRLTLAVLVPGLFVCVLSTQEAVGPNSKCGGYTLYKDAGGYLVYHEMPVTFDHAKRRCAVEGGVLASPINAGIKAAMVDILWKSRNVNAGVFTGFSAKPDNGGIFSSIEGTRLSNIEHTWAPDEPNNGDGLENCIVLSPRGVMSDVNCNHQYPYICLLREGRLETKTICSEGYAALDNTIGSCHKLHSTPLRFDDAAKVCEQEGGHLVIINGDNEAQAVKNLLVKNNLQYAYLGFQLNKNLGKWITVQGETIEDAGYAKWIRGWNSSYTASIATERVSGFIDNDDGLLRYVSPPTTWPFICEKGPEIDFCE